MSVQDAYRAKRITHAELVAKMKSGDLIIFGTWLGQSHGILKAIGQFGQHIDPLYVWLAPALDAGDILLQPNILCLSTFLGPHERAVRRAGKAVTYTPLQYTDAHRIVRAGRPPEFLTVRTVPMDERGYFNLSLTSSWQDNAIRWLSRHESAARIVLEVNRHMPRVYGLPAFGNHEIHIADVDWVVEDDTPLSQYTTPEPTAIDRAIAAHVAGLVEDRATIQLGFGSIPMVIGHMLAERKDLGIHSEMLCQAHVDLIEAGSVTNAHKGLYDGVSVATFALGEDRLYRWLADNRAVAMLPVEEVNAVPVLARLRKMTSINSILNIDLSGQACAHCLVSQTYSGVGGAFEFAYGAQLTPGGKCIHCLRSTTTLRDGREVSNIVAQHPAGTRMTIPEHCIDWVVTEYGGVRLKLLDQEWRAAALIRIAHPKFREDLTAQAQANGLDLAGLSRHRPAAEHFYSS